MTQIQQMSDAEMEIMRLIWNNGGQILFGPLMSELDKKGRSWKANTVLTFLTRMTEKGILCVEKRGRLNIYYAQLSENEYLEGLTQTFVSKVYGGDAKSLVAALLRRECLKKQDIDEIQAFWEEAKENE